MSKKPVILLFLLSSIGLAGETRWHSPQPTQERLSVLELHPTLEDLTVSNPNSVYLLSHDSFADFEPNEHIDWTLASQGVIDATNIEDKFLRNDGNDETSGALTAAGFTIGLNTLDTTEWAYLDGLDQALKTSDAPSFASGVTIGNLTLAGGSITDSSGAISFGDEDLNTIGTGGFGDVDITGNLDANTIVLGGTLDANSQDISSVGTITATTLTDGVASLNSGSLSSAVSGTFSATVQAEQLTSTDDITMQGHLFTLGDGSDNDIKCLFSANTKSGDFYWKEDEDYFEFSDDIFIPSTEKVYIRDTGLSFGSDDDGYMDYTAAYHRFNPETAGQDIFMKFNGQTNDGYYYWNDDQDRFDFANNLLVTVTKRIYFRDTQIGIHSPFDGYLQITVDGGLRINGSAGDSGTFTSADGKTITVTHGIITNIN